MCGVVTAIKSESRVPLAQQANALENAERFGEIERFAMFDNDDGGGGEKAGRGEIFQHARIIACGCVGRVDKHIVILVTAGFELRFQSFETAKGVSTEDRRVRGNFQRSEIFVDERDAGRVIFDECCVSGAATQGFYADGAGAGEDIEEARAGNSRAKDVEKSFAQAIAGGTHGETLEGLEDAAAMSSSDYAHDFILPG